MAEAYKTVASSLFPSMIFHLTLSCYIIGKLVNSQLPMVPVSA